MSEETHSEEPPAAAAPPKSKMVPLLLLFNSLLLAGVLGFMFMNRAPTASAASSTAEGAHAADGTPGGEKAVGPAIGPTLKLDAFVIHLRNPEVDRYIRVSFDLEIVAETDRDLITKFIPRIRDAVISYMSDRTVEEMRGSEGLERVKRGLAEIFDSFIPGRRIKSIYISEFVIQ